MIRMARNASLLRLSVELKSIGLHFGQRIPLLVRPREEGWLRHQEKCRRSPHQARRRGGRLHRNVTCERPPRPLSRPPLLTRRGVGKQLRKIVRGILWYVG